MVLGKYKLKGPVLYGGTAIVRNAEDDSTDKKVAIKLTLNAEEALNELKLMKLIRSPVITFS